MKKKQPYRSRKSVTKRSRSSMTVKRKRKPKENKLIQFVTKALRLIILFGISAFIIYQLFKSDHETEKTEQQIDTPPQQSEVDYSDQTDYVEDERVNIDTLSISDKLNYSIKNILLSYNINESWIQKKQKSLRIQLPPELPAEIVIYDIIHKVKELNLKCIDSKENLKRSRSSLMVVSKNDTLLSVYFNKNKNIQRQSGKIAIVIDDFGYFNNKITESFLELEYPVTLSILPGLKYTKKIAEKAKQYGKQIMLHLPMEPKRGKVEQTDFTILTNLSEYQIVERINKALKMLPDAIGVNNHMGSKATENPQVMDALFKELKRKNIMFVDSKTSLNSIAPVIAEKYDLKFEQNSTFLERHKNEEKRHIKSKLKLAAKISKKMGKVVIIGHPYQETIDVLTEELPKLEKQGFVIVPVTDLDK